MKVGDLVKNSDGETGIVTGTEYTHAGRLAHRVYWNVPCPFHKSLEPNAEDYLEIISESW